MYLPSLTDRAELAVNCLTEFCDKSQGRLPYFYTRLSDRPITASLATWSYGDGLGRSIDALILLRAMLGQELGQEPERIMIQTLISLLDEDGLSWCPATPWTMSVPHTRPAWLQQGTLLAMTTLYQATGLDEYRRIAEKNIQAVIGMTRYHAEGYGDYPGEFYTREAGWSAAPNDPMHRHSVFSTSITMPLMRYFRVTGYEPALKLASNLIAWALRDHHGGKTLFEAGHFHCQSRLMTAIILRGITTGNSEDLELGKTLYHKARSLGTRSGWFPEQINNPEHNRANLSETCCLTDMLESAILLAQHMNTSYWHDAECYVKNHLLAHQIVDADWFTHLTFVPPQQHEFKFVPGSGGCVQDQALENALVGGFSGWGGVSAMSDDTIMSNTNQHCCNAAGARALYDAWYHSLSDDGVTLSINLHIHRSHPAADIIVAEGEQGVLMIQVKRDRKLKIRIPEFVSQDQITVSVNGRAIQVDAADGFICIGCIKRGDMARVVFPNCQFVSQESIAPGTYNFSWQGSAVVSAVPFQGIKELFVPERFFDKPPALICCGKQLQDSIA